LSEKRERKLSEVNAEREKILSNQEMLELKSKMSDLNEREMELNTEIQEGNTSIAELMSQLDELNRELNTKKMYSIDEHQSFDQVIGAENETIERARQQLERNKQLKEENYALIHKELETVKENMVKECLEGDSTISQIKSELRELGENESKLRTFLNECLYENDEEKCLVENELGDLIEQREHMENQVWKLTNEYLNAIELKMQSEYEAFEQLKRQEAEEIRQEEERIDLLVNSSVAHLKELIEKKREQIQDEQRVVRTLKNKAEASAKQLNEFLAELEILENERLIKENKLFHEEIKIANEAKVEYEKLANQKAKLDLFYSRKVDQVRVKRETLKPKLVAMVGSNRGLMLFNADFNAKLAAQQTPVASLTRKLSQSIQSLNFIDHIAYDFRSNNKTFHHMNELNEQCELNSLKSSTSTLDIFVCSAQNNLQTKFDTTACKSLGIQLNINGSVLIGKKTWDEHYEYALSVKVNEESWLIFRRYSKMRELHEKMCLLYPSLHRLVFPMRHVLKTSTDKHLIERQLQLEHYLRCFIEIILNEPSCPLSRHHSPASSVLNNSISSSNSSLNQPFINKAKLCSICPFFEQSSNDLLLLNKFQFNNQNSFLFHN